MSAYDQTFAAERPFRAAFDNSPIGMALVAPDGRFLQVNRTLSRFLGRSREALLRMRLQDVTHPADLERDDAQLRRLAAGEIPSHQTEMRYVHADGTVMTAALHVDAIADENGRPECFVGQLKDVTETKRAEEEVDRYREQLEFAQELSALGSFTFDPASAQWTWSAGLYRLSGRDPRSPEPSHADIFESILHPEDRERVLAGMTRAIQTGGSLDMRYRVIRADGEVRTVFGRARMVDTEAGGTLFIGVIQDLTDGLELRAARDEAEVRFEAIFESAPIGVCLTALGGEDHGAVLRANAALGQQLGRPASELEGVRLVSLLHPEDRAALAAELERLAHGTPHVELEVRVCPPDGQEAWALVSAAPILAGDGAPEHAVTQILDISERKVAERRLHYIADHDPLTGLYNRRRFDRDVTQALAHADRYGTHGVMLLLDLDRFKLINDNFGHSAGDGVISQVAGELCRTLRSTDIPARIGGDEFAVLLPEAGEAEGLAVARKLVDAVATLALPVGDSSVARVTVSVGITAFGPGSDVTTDDLIAEADIAVYEAKNAGRSTVRAFPVQQQREERITQLRARWVERLRDAIALDRFRLVAQPIADICSRSVPRAELLLRYVDDEGELVGPANFLYLAERYDLIHEIDRWVIGQAIGILHRSHRAGRPVGLSVNLSGRTLAEETLADEIAALLVDQPIPPGSLTIEVTETAAITNLARAHDFAERLHEFGCRFALDDFGAGFASFYYLKHLDFDEIKIDGEFVRHLRDSRVDRLVIEAVVGIAKGLGATTVAEFVSDDETVELLRSMGVDHGQGYHLGQPVPVEELLGRPSPFGPRWVRAAYPGGHGRPADAAPAQSSSGGGSGSGGAATAGVPAR
jgi:diguanylate cyclase (GGDEF)-like protein/PAS domain S-box-containing protein